MKGKMGFVSAVMAAGVTNTLLLSAVCITSILAVRSSESRRLELKANRMQEAFDRIARAVARELEQARDDSASSERRKAALDNIQKFLDIMRSTNPQV